MHLRRHSSYVPSPNASLSTLILSLKWAGSISEMLWLATPSTRCEESTEEASRACRSMYMTLGPILFMVTVAKTATSLATGAPLPRTELVWTRRFRQEVRRPFWIQGRDLAATDNQARAKVSLHRERLSAQAPSLLLQGANVVHKQDIVRESQTRAKIAVYRRDWRLQI